MERDGLRLTDDSRCKALEEIINSNTGIVEEILRSLVQAFYAKIRADAELGPIFMDHVSDGDVHLDRMCQFWSSVMLTSGKYHGQPVQKHASLEINTDHFVRWLFEETAKQVRAKPGVSDLLLVRVHTIAAMLLNANKSHRTLQNI